MTTLRDPLSMLIKLVKKHSQKLTEAKETFEVISNRMSTIDNPQELVSFLGQHLKPKELEKKQNGEVFTPPDLIQQKFNKLTLADPLIWSDPSKKFLDPANGIGNYPALAFHRLMEGLKIAIPNEADRKKHILENMLYMCELNKKNVEVSRTLFDPKGEYNLNLYQGSYLDLDPTKELGVEKFDVVFGNPPYQPPSNGKKGGKSLWPTFVEKSMKLLKVNGFLVFVHPALWRMPENELHDLMFGKQFHYLSIHSKQEGDKVFRATTRYDWYILQNQPSKVPTPVRFDDDIIYSVMITQSLPFIVNHGFSIVNRLIQKAPNGFLSCEKVSECHTQLKHVSKQKKHMYIYPLVTSSSKTRGIRLCWSTKPTKSQYSKKVILSDGEVIHPFYDTGKFGTTESGMFIPVKTDNEGKLICRYLKSKLVSFINAACKWSNFATKKHIFSIIPHPKDLPDNFTDSQVYAYFGLTPEEIGRIEADQRKGGLADYVALEAPDVVVSLPPTPVIEPDVSSTSDTKIVKRRKPKVANNVLIVEPVTTITTTQPDYNKMKKSELIQACKDKKIKGYSGKKNEELIAMLTA